MKVKMTDADYLNKYLADWKEATNDLFKGDMMNKFLELKERQFDVKLYKKQLKKQSKIEEITDDFFIGI